MLPNLTSAFSSSAPHMEKLPDPSLLLLPSLVQTHSSLGLRISPFKGSCPEMRLLGSGLIDKSRRWKTLRTLWWCPCSFLPYSLTFRKLIASDSHTELMASSNFQIFFIWIVAESITFFFFPSLLSFFSFSFLPPIFSQVCIHVNSPVAY